MKIGPGNDILELFKYEKMSTETHVLKTAPASYTLPLQTAPEPLPLTCAFLPWAVTDSLYGWNMVFHLQNLCLDTFNIKVSNICLRLKNVMVSCVHFIATIHIKVYVYSEYQLFGY